ncbi:hypothetical protein MNBD_IGNAVI01-1108 [hydrothermal vent metagenome]|uniref:histidine kinase n=1 Tax=hydrothermal vent metagenome TaxID=652676 RepID=A0A3B1CVJ3_9ZZZZ
MAKDIFSSQNKVKVPLITKSVKRNSIWVISLLMVVFLIFNFFMMRQLQSFFKNTIDDRLHHELGHIKASIVCDNNSFKIINPTELNEKAMGEVSENSFFLQIYDTSKNLLFASKNLENYEPIPLITLDFKGDYLFNDLNIKYTGLRTGYTKLYDCNGNLKGFIQLSTPKIKMNEVVEKIINLTLYSLPVVIFLFALISLFFIKKTLNPINKIIDVANEITATNISKRITYEAESTDELGRLKQTLNNLFDRLEFQINQISHFSDNASHQLMTPLTAINTELEFIMRNGHPKDECRESFEIIKSQTEKMIHIVKTLLILAREGETDNASRKVFNFSTLIETDLSKEFKDQKVSFEIEKNIYLKGESDYFKVVMENLISNGLKYSNNMEVTVSATVSENRVKIEVKDQGIGIPDDEKEKVFERFYRGNTSEIKGIQGYGLGLSLVKLVVKQMKGEIYIEDNYPRGTIFIVDLPIVNLV